MPHEAVPEQVERMIQAALLQQASDIHVEPGVEHYRIRYRLDGHLREIEQTSARTAERMVSCLKVMAQLDISERRLPQDGRIGFVLPDGSLRDLRISTLPVLGGEKVVLRLLPAARALPLAGLGMLASQLSLLEQALALPHGLVLITGPTGSGKSTSLYACLLALNRPERNLCTVEDPVEMVLPGLNQVAVSDKSGLSFALALRAILRQDPDILMVGEMRDVQTADIAIKAAQTGHLVLSSLHTASASLSLSRLLNLGLTIDKLAGCLQLIVAQRLLRRLCQHCRLAASLPPWIAWPVPDSQLAEAGTIFSATGCPHCQGTGYRGRLAIFECLPVDDGVLARWQAGQRLVLTETLRGAALLRVLAGDTSLTEAIALTPEPVV